MALTFPVVFLPRAVHRPSLGDLQGLLGVLREEHHVVAVTELPLLILPLKHTTASYSQETNTQSQCNYLKMTSAYQIFFNARFSCIHVMETTKINNYCMLVWLK